MIIFDLYLKFGCEIACVHSSELPPLECSDYIREDNSKLRAVNRQQHCQSRDFTWSIIVQLTEIEILVQTLGIL